MNEQRNEKARREHEHDIWRHFPWQTLADSTHLRAESLTNRETVLKSVHQTREIKKYFWTHVTYRSESPAG